MLIIAFLYLKILNSEKVKNSIKIEETSETDNFRIEKEQFHNLPFVIAY